MTTPFSARGLNQIITKLFVDLKRRPLLRNAKRIRKHSPLKYAGACRHQIECVESRLLLTGSDSFAGRTNLGSVISITDTGTNVGFTAESGEPVQSGVVNSAWWTWTAPSNGTLVVDTIGSNFDTFLTLATGSAVDALSVVAQDDDGGGGVSSRIAASVTSGTAYQFAVDGFAIETGSITLNLTFATASISPGVWTAQGPGPTINAQVTIPANNPINGAIQTIATHPTNSDIMYVGTVNGGIWKTTNATTANTWTPLTDTLPSQSIGAIEFDVTDPTFNTLLAGTGRWSNYAEIGDDSGMLYYTTNGGTSWTVLSPGVLANQKISAVAVRGNTWLVTSISGGVYRSTNGGATFTSINGLNGLGTGGTQDMVADPTSSNRFYVTMQGSGGIFRTDNAGATWTNVTGTVTGISGASRVRLAVNASAGAVYVAVGAGNAGAATRVWRSANQGGSWTQMDDVFVHNGGQQDPNTSLAADPTNPNLVYVGGDRISASPFTGLSYRGNAAAASGSQWSILVNAGASNTAPHADTRDMAFRADGTLLESDDGGMYRHTNPAGTGSWVAAAGNIAAIEAHNVAYNSLNNTLVIGTQDNGTHLQPTSGNSQWTFINGGDGGDVAVDSVTLAGNNQSIVYLSSQNLGGFRRVVYGSNNNFVSSTNLAGITDVNFTTPIELNTINPQRILIGGSSALFESTNQGTTNTNIGGPGQPGFLQNAMVYGGSLNGTPNPDLIYVGANSAVFKRTTSGGAITATTALPSGAGQVNDVAIDPNNYNTVFATDNNQVFMSSNGGTSWSDITGNLGLFSSLNEIRTAVYVPGAAPYLAVGTRSGVFASLASNPGAWVKLGTVLPDALVFDLVYNATDDVLIAGTFGRGVWTMPTASTILATPPNDFGDAPDSLQSGFASSYPVTTTENGAKHTATGPTLGANRDSEADGAHSLSADADDTTGSPDDEDGITFAGGTILVSRTSTSTGTVSVNLQNADAASNRLDAWIDWNRDGDWNDADEQIFANFNLGATNGTQSLSFAIPHDTGINVQTGATYARFRLSTTGGLATTGAAASGEVEDLLVSIMNQPEGTAGNDAFVLTYSASTVTITNGAVSLGTFPVAVPLRLYGLGGTDSVKIVGTTGSDLIQVTNFSSLLINGSELTLDSTESLLLAGGSGNDTYGFNADNMASTLTILSD